MILSKLKCLVDHDTMGGAEPLSWYVKFDS